MFLQSNNRSGQQNIDATNINHSSSLDLIDTQSIMSLVIVTLSTHEPTALKLTSRDHFNAAAAADQSEQILSPTIGSPPFTCSNFFTAGSADSSSSRPLFISLTYESVSILWLIIHLFAVISSPEIMSNPFMLVVVSIICRSFPAVHLCSVA